MIFAEQLAQACPQGIDVYYENVGGKVFDAVLPLLNTAARVPVCGLVSGYNATGLPDGPDRLPLLMATILKKRIRMQGFIIGQDYGHRIAEFQQQMGRWVQEGKIKYREQLIDGLDQAPQALIGLLKGENFGKGGDPRRGGRLAWRASTEQAPFSAREKGPGIGVRRRRLTAGRADRQRLRGPHPASGVVLGRLPVRW
ncbi:oxidoreductase YncB [Klebsiella pneumoniae subsp. ozaenae]|uniref:Oxidoreductase YncB n=1 Tax=Klebsiella pneumoniae subsp. ozaenae TaxID=574 RepID=A0A378B318_KLEPO|nr:oxidoreductase YncB [Klebsiella pneumoniae subsp. ozaenae]